ncbi:hypothetical protein ETD86_40895 [Nonomuraea turkmeniaca]|uniref:Uncharacterized protein n=1 Tax=Nonomuraea turkmeniaca TaxID=103838 RepID=A0A5S4F270_9ACTN|nr:hypothetical protein [Nonomuraea turkmeniaca]TMR10085.1 hypothetical protein ETD86_40895 [Nonomuraea turkmeniaca]
MTPETFGFWFFTIFLGVLMLIPAAYLLYWIGYLLLALTAAIVEAGKALASLALRLIRTLRLCRS